MNEYLNKAIFCDNQFYYIQKIAMAKETVIFISEKTLSKIYLGDKICLTYKQISADFAYFLDLIENKIIVLMDIHILYRYDKPITRFLLNVASYKTSKKIVIGEKMFSNYIYEIYSYMFFLDKKIIDINHYWCFKANHMEENIFTKEPIRMHDLDYLAKKLYKKVIIDKKNPNNLEYKILKLKK